MLQKLTTHGRYVRVNGVENLSKNARFAPRQDRTIVNTSTIRPMEGFDGMVVFSATGTYTYANTGIDVRPSVVFHEWWENYERTVNNQPYLIPVYENGCVLPGRGVDPKWANPNVGAHQLSTDAEATFYARIPTPGAQIKYTPPAK